MEEATEYKAYLKALKEATDSVKEDKQDKAAKAVAKMKITNFSCGGMGIAEKGGKFTGVK
tara:strand:+ start:146 stop:325 length:180 start_codon:yes stop_codon:yes gene_type:complete